MERIFITKQGKIVIIYDDGKTDTPIRHADGRITFKLPERANPYVRAHVLDRFLELEAMSGNRVYEE